MNKIFEGHDFLEVNEIAYKWQQTADAHTHGLFGTGSNMRRLQKAISAGFLIQNESFIAMKNFKNWLRAKPVDIPDEWKKSG